MRFAGITVHRCVRTHDRRDHETGGVPLSPPGCVLGDRVRWRLPRGGDPHRLAEEPFLRRVLLADRSEEHTSELQSLMRISYAVCCLKKTKTEHQNHDASKLYITTSTLSTLS